MGTAASKQCAELRLLTKMTQWCGASANLQSCTSVFIEDRTYKKVLFFSKVAFTLELSTHCNAPQCTPISLRISFRVKFELLKQFGT